MSSSLFGVQTAPSANTPAVGGFPFKAIASGLRLIALIAFVMPFATVSCGSQDLMTINGLQAAFGTNYYIMGQAGHADGDPFFVAALVLIAAAFVAGLLRASQSAGLLSDHQLNVTAMALGLLATAIFLIAAVSAGQSNSQAGAQAGGPGTELTLRWEFGFWLALLGILISTALSAVNAFPQQFGLQMARFGIGARQLVASTAVQSRGAPPGAIAIGTLSPDGNRFWNGVTWLNIDDTPGPAPTVIGTLSSDGTRFWNGADWVAVE